MLNTNETHILINENIDDPIYIDLQKTNQKYLQLLIERLLFYTENDYECAISNLHREILLSDAQILDQVDQGAISISEIKNRLSKEKQKEYKEPMYLIERLLWTLLQIEYKDEQLTDVVELMLVKSNLDYKMNQNVLMLLKKYDSSYNKTVKFLQWEILSGIAEEHIKNISSNLLNPAEQQEIISFEQDINSAIINPKHLDDLFEAVFASGSIEVLKYLIKQIDLLNLRSKLDCPILVNCIYWSIFVKNENKSKFEECFRYALEKEKHNLGAQDSVYGDTALHLANDLEDKFIIAELLKYHAPIGIKNKNGKFPVSNISTDDLKNFLDSLISDTPKVLLEYMENWKIIKLIFIEEFNLKNLLFIDYESFVSKNSKDECEELYGLELLNEIKDSKEQCELINHPVISSIIELHWNRLKFEIVINKFCFLFTSLIILLALLLVNKIANVNYIDTIIIITTTFLILLQLLNNYTVFVQFYKFIIRSIKSLNKKCTADSDDDRESFKQISNSYQIYGTLIFFILTLSLLMLINIYAIKKCNQYNENCNQILIFIIIILFLNILLLFGYFSRSIAINIIFMFHVTYTSIKCIILYLSILFGFILSLYLLVNNNETENELTSLYTLKIVFNSTSEFKFRDLKFFYTVTYFELIYFVFIISIIFIIIFKVLAEVDIKTIKNKIKILHQKLRIIILCAYKNSPKSIFNQKLKSKIIYFNKKDEESLYKSDTKKKSLIGIKTTTNEIFYFKDIDNSKVIGRLPQSVVDNAIRILYCKNNV